MRDVQRKTAVAFCAGRERIEAGGDHFGSDAVAADCRDPVGAHECPFVSVGIYNKGNARGRVLAPRTRQE
jgi:hypothetical protein